MDLSQSLESRTRLWFLIYLRTRSLSKIVRKRLEAVFPALKHWAMIGGASRPLEEVADKSLTIR
jgi:hypothetical protein